MRIQRFVIGMSAVVFVASPGIASAQPKPAAPGMGMGGRTERYDVVSFTNDGKTKVFATHGK